MKRRNFIRSGALALAGFTILPRHILGGTNFVAPSDQINLGIIGCGAQGRWTLAPEFARRANLIAASDCESRQLNAMQAIVEKETEKAKGQAYKGFKLYADYHELLNRSDIDGVIIATPDHWHAVQTIEACRAGKDVYVEKPMSHSIEEGRAMADAVEKYNRVLQVGNMQRSWRNFRHACELVRNGYIGEIKEVKVSIGPPPVKYDLPAQPVPKTLDWEMWIGPAPMNVYNEELAPPMERNMFPNWRNYREYGGGMICDWGAHMFDIAQWALGMDDSGPIEFTLPEEGELKPLSMRYANGTVMTHEPFRKADGNAVRFIGSDGVIDISRSFLDTIPAKLQDEVIGDDKIKLYKSDDHYNDFLTAMKTRKQPLSTVEIGHRTASLCHIVNLCYEFDRKLVWNPEKEEFFFDDEANRRRGNPIREPYSLKV
ncbi:Gfo/Idh/MocA family protein [Parabacteroides goldsteinii]|uniref:Gfo/Idh/MocA family protein n=1 Tax=Parabacteroides goldsteinii TaxID=328812 RepID=UPI000E9646C4|nr:Gfo/Idh/MocA family oxidoreductase [Parabacteroides goldsteinii]HBA30309.1 oxidoreductase [Parabacteroides goldsteinii]